MLSNSLIRSLKPSDKKRHTDRDGLVLELRPSKKRGGSTNNGVLLYIVKSDNIIEFIEVTEVMPHEY